MDDVRLLEVLDEAVRAVRGALDVLEDWGPSGGKPGQYRLDLAADGAALPVLHGAGLAVHRTWSWLTQLKPNLSMERSMLRRFGATATTFAFVALGWVLFASPTIEMAGHVYRGLISATAGATTPGSRSFDAHR